MSKSAILVMDPTTKQYKIILNNDQNSQGVIFSMTQNFVVIGNGELKRFGNRLG